MQGLDLLVDQDSHGLRVVPDDVGGDARGAHAVRAADLDGALPQREFGDLSKGRGAGLTGDDEGCEAVQVSGCARVPGNHHVVGLAVYRHGRHGLADEVLAELEADLARGEAEEGGLLRVHLYRHLGARLRDGVLQVDDLLDGAEGSGQFARNRGDVVVVCAGDVDLHAACRRAVLDLDDGDRDAGPGQLLPERPGDVVRGVVLEGDEELGAARLPSAREEAELRRADRHRVEVGYLVEPFLYRHHFRERLLRRGPRGHDDPDTEVRGLAAEQVDGDDGGQAEARQRDRGGGEERDELVPQHPPQDGGVDALEGGLRQHEVALVSGSLGQVAGAEEVRAQDRDGGERDEQRRDEGERHRERERGEERPEQARDERQRQEYDNGGEGRGDDGGAYLGGRVERGAPALAPALDVAVDVLQHDDGVVHDAPHGDGEPAERHEVERHVLREHQQDAGQDAERDGEGDDDGGAERVEEAAHDRRPDGEHEDEDDGDGEEEAEHRLPGEGVDLPLDLGALVRNDDELDVRRQPLDAVERVVDRGRHVDGVGVGLLGDGHADAALPVRAVDAVGHAVSEGDGRDVGEAHDACRRGAADDEILDLLHRLQRVGRLGDDGLRAVEEEPCGQREVVLHQRARHLEQGDVAGRHPLRVHGDAHAAVHRAGE